MYPRYYSQTKKRQEWKTMKILCDVCWKEEAYAFCSADEAALCQNCDVRVHRANKLAAKHPRFLLLNSQFQDSPLCDICQVKRALFFCREDRALLCKECERSIHKANEHTKKHNRFLLTGVELSAAAASFNVAASSSESETKINNSITSEINFLPNLMTNCSESSSNPWGDNKESSKATSQVSSSSMTDYLMETLPSWHVEDLMDPSSHYGFHEIYDQMSFFTDEELEGNFGAFASNDDTPAQEQSLAKVSEKKKVVKGSSK